MPRGLRPLGAPEVRGSMVIEVHLQFIAASSHVHILISYQYQIDKKIISCVNIGVSLNVYRIYLVLPHLCHGFVSLTGLA